MAQPDECRSSHRLGHRVAGWRVHCRTHGWVALSPPARRGGGGKGATRIRIRGGRIACAPCGRAVARVAVLEPGRPVCAECASEPRDDGPHAHRARPGVGIH